ncbi:hypothetical protein [Rhizobium sp. 18065]|uniref:hypothetical protein n=1 Tax=Rhizobium sp. 18065 TaxID=2681411 RepID=UPI00135C4AE6|nr:hypothetical protein [Rhizobium sp. 18065]
MSEFRLSFPACVIAGKQKLSANDILHLRSRIFPDGVPTSADVIPLVALNDGRSYTGTEWQSFVVEQLEALADSLSNDPQWPALTDQLMPCPAKSLPPSPDTSNVRWLKVPDSVFLDENHAA